MLDLNSGSFTEIPYPATFGAVEEITVTGGIAWVTYPYYDVDGRSPQVGRLDLATGGFQVMEGAVAAFAEGPGGEVYGTAGGMAGPQGLTVGSQGLVAVSEGGLIPMTPHSSDLAGVGVPSGDALAVDHRSGVVWIAAEIRKDIVRVDQRGGSARTRSPRTTHPITRAQPPRWRATLIPAAGRPKWRQ